MKLGKTTPNISKHKYTCFECGPELHRIEVFFLMFKSAIPLNSVVVNSLIVIFLTEKRNKLKQSE